MKGSVQSNKRDIAGLGGNMVSMVQQQSPSPEYSIKSTNKTRNNHKFQMVAAPNSEGTRASFSTNVTMLVMSILTLTLLSSSSIPFGMVMAVEPQPTMEWTVDNNPYNGGRIITWNISWSEAVANFDVTKIDGLTDNSIQSSILTGSFVGFHHFLFIIPPHN
jgi:hypothetical protein